MFHVSVRGCLHRENSNERLTGSLQASHTEMVNQKPPKALNDFRGFLVTRMRSRNPRFARGKLRQENRNENLTDSLQGSHTESDNQKAPTAMNDYRGFLVTRTGIEPMFPA